MDYSKIKIIVGTEIYRSEKFSNLWLKAAKVNIPADVPVIVFDNNPENWPESKKVEKTCNESGYRYFKLAPNSWQDTSVEALMRYASDEYYDVYFHLDIDCPPLKGMFEKMIAHILDGATAVTEKAGAHCFAAKTVSTRGMSCRRLPFLSGESETRFSHFTSKPNHGGLRYFDHCRLIFHRLESRGDRVDIVDYGFLHPAMASLFDPDSSRQYDIEGKQELADQLKAAHISFWNNEEVKDLLCQP